MSLLERLKEKLGFASPDPGRAPIRIFLLEDDERRCAWFEKRFKGDTLHISCDIEEAKQLLESNTYDSIFLDHDLIPEHYHSETTDDERTGYAIAAFLAARPELSARPPSWYTALTLKARCEWSRRTAGRRPSG
jgi:hypothetical protein